MQQADTFFATQIGQLKAPQLQQPQNDQIDTPPPPLPAPVPQQTNSLKSLLIRFNGFDKEEKGVISFEQVSAILTQLKLSHTPAELQSLFAASQPLLPGHVSFDGFLFIVDLVENSGQQARVDPRLAEFLKQGKEWFIQRQREFILQKQRKVLLNLHRKKYEKQSNYAQATRSKNKINEIREAEWQRRKHYLDNQYQSNVEQAQTAQQRKFIEFCETWDGFMNEYETTAVEMMRKLKEKQANQLIEFEGKVREQWNPKVHYSKQILELQIREKNLVRLQDYIQAAKVQAEIEDLRKEEEARKKEEDAEAIETRINGLKKTQQAMTNNLLQKIQRDRNEQLKQRQSDTDKLLVRNKNSLNDLAHRHQESIRKLYESLHNMNLDGLGSTKNVK